MTTLSTKMFHIDSEMKEFCADISDLPKPRDFCARFTETCFTLQSHKTGALSKWVGCGCEVDPDGDILFWTFRPTQDPLFHNPLLNGWKVTVYND